MVRSPSKPPERKASPARNPARPAPTMTIRRISDMASRPVVDPDDDGLEPGVVVQRRQPALATVATVSVPAEGAFRATGEVLVDHHVSDRQVPGEAQGTIDVSGEDPGRKPIVGGRRDFRSLAVTAERQHRQDRSEDLVTCPGDSRQT